MGVKDCYGEQRRGCDGDPLPTECQVERGERWLWAGAGLGVSGLWILVLQTHGRSTASFHVLMKFSGCRAQLGKKQLFELSSTQTIICGGVE